MLSSRMRPAGVLVALGLVGSTFAVGLGTSAQANQAGTGLVISEVYGGGGNTGAPYTNDFIELYNPTASPIPVDGWSVQGRSATSTSAASGDNITPLSGSVPPGGYYLVQQQAGTTVTNKPLPTPNATGNMGMAAGGWQIWLANTTTGLDPVDGDVTAAQNAAIIDLVGAATNSASFEKLRANEAPSNTLSTQRTGNIDTDHNANDFNTGAPAPQNSTQALSATDPQDVNASVGTPMSAVVLQAAGGTPPYAWEVTGLPAGLSETSDGVIEGTPSAAGVSTVTATVTDAATPTAGSDSVEFTITVQPPVELSTIAQVQGTPGSQGDDVGTPGFEAISPKVGQRVKVRGVVTARYPTGTGNLWGFALQTGGKEGVDYNTPGASDAVFVYPGGQTMPAIGASVEVVGTVEERFLSTQISAPGDREISLLATPLPAVVPGDTIPGTDCALPGDGCLTGDALEALREEHEGEAFLPTGAYTVTDSYDGTPFTQAGSRGFQMQGEIGLAANSVRPLMVPTELFDQSDTAALADRRAWNDAHSVILDDGADRDYTSNTYEDEGFPWLAPSNPVRVGAAVTFKKPVILEFRRDFWRVQPQTKVEPGTTGTDRVSFANTRTNAPEDVLGDTGDLKIATFNMLNYFNTLGEAWAASDGSSAGSDSSAFSLTNPRRCSYHTDRGPVPPATGSAARLTNDTCIQDAIDPLTGLRIQLPGPRGAANDVNFLRQEAKELEAINTIDADVMSLEEVENSIKLYDETIDGPDGADRDRDDALRRLVQKLNEHWAAGHSGDEGVRWALAPSPRREAQPTVAEQDAIRSAFIYNPGKVELVGRSRILTNSPAMRNAREPLAQAFKPLGAGRADAFGVVVNHFKSKGGPQAPSVATGDNLDAGDGAGWYNGDRKRQASALVAFADQFASDRNIGPMFLTGDFNSYSQEDPVQVIEQAGYTNLKPSNGETTYSFGGLAGSLDHVFANPAAADMVTGEDVWAINAGESVYYEYSRYNASATDLYAVNPFRSSDHNPEIVGIDVGDATPDPARDVVQVLGINDFHGRLLATEGGPEAGAASLAGAVKQLRAENPDTVFAAAGDLVGASTFESFIANDKPTIDALNEAGLEVSAAGNHEFDQGYDDLVSRIMAPYDAETNPEGGALWEYIAGNVRFKEDGHDHEAGDAALPETWYSELGEGRTVGFVGAVTEDLPALVAAGGIEDIVVTDIVDAVNENAADLKDEGGCGEVDGCDLVVMLVHEGAATPAYSSVTDDSTFAQIVAEASAEIDAIVSGHTHLAYNHKVPVAQWEAEERAVTERPVVSAGQYGAKLNRLEFEFLPGTEELVDVRQTVLDLNDYDADPATQVIVDDAAEAAAAQGNVPLGDIEAPFQRARRNDPISSAVVENRGGESTLGNLVAEIQRWQVGADIAFMNPGGLRADMLGLDGDPRILTYRQAADVQPFANTLVAMDLTGAQIRTILEQQWQRDVDGNIPSRPFLRLGTSDGLVVTEDASRAEGDRVTGIWLDGQALDPEQTYRVVANSFLASGTGDNFWGFADASNKQDTGKTDLQGVVEYMAEFAPHDETTLPVDYRQHAVGVRFPDDAPATYESGDTLAFTLSSLAMTGSTDVQDGQVELLLGDTVLGTFPVTNSLPDNPDYDAAGTASISVQLPEGARDGSTELTVRGVTTGTEVPVVISTSDGLPDSTVAAEDSSMVFGQQGSVEVTVTPATATGSVSVLDGLAVLGSADLDQGSASVTIPAQALAVGEHDLTLVYGGSPETSASRGAMTMTVTRAPSLTRVEVPGRTPVFEPVPVTAVATAHGFVPEGDVVFLVDGVEVATAALEDGEASVELDAFRSVGSRSITARYLGDDSTRPSESAPSTVAIVRATPSMTVTASPDRITTKSMVTMTIALAATGQVPEGTVTVTWGRKKERLGTLSGGQVAFGLGEFDPPGDYTFQVSYSGSPTVEPSSTTHTITVEKK